eukprot:CAMPEP_0116570398 /NCGR_PEP_ID=MMETSP0397-20121206/16918_1 /TAXON_ID=216820 /ORGANISM="Cyclophora tenuis, Strain ECT3854" /LENGTH=219 /DNA_ID=CAMNT_0004098251 /DNA_START=247 /DNA_END=906 /DNA_ORIENTATION=-
MVDTRARQVNGWGFRRVTHGSDYNSYYHEMFLRGMPHLCEKMRRLTNKDTAAKKKAEDEPAPDFYALSRVYPLPDSAPPRPNPVRATAPPPGLLDAHMETALLERRRADLLERVNLLAASSNALRPDALTSFSMSQGGASMLRPGMMFDHGLPSAAPPAPQQALQQLLARQAGPDMAQILAMNNAGMGAPGMGMSAGMGMGAGMGIGGMPNFVAGGFNL